jgi:predicted aspartyl protease
MIKPPQIFQYSPDRNPPAPMLNLAFANPFTQAITTEVFLIDSGADITCLKEELFDKLSLEYCSYIKVRGATGEQVVRTAAIILHSPFGKDELIEVIISPALRINLLGRDLVNKWKVTLDGPNQQMTIEV